GEAELAIARRQPYGKWYDDGVVRLDDLPAPPGPPTPDLPLEARQLAFGYTREDIDIILESMVATAKEPTGSMGDDSALAVLSDCRPPLFRYFKQRFAQVTNPAIDPEREGIVMSLTTRLGPAVNLLEETPDHVRGVELPQPVLDDQGLARLHAIPQPELGTATIDCTWPVGAGVGGLRAALEAICDHAARAVSDGAGILVLSDRGMSPDAVAVPSLLATAAVHHHLVREGCRLQAGLVVESGEPREVHHVACLIGYGAGAVNPYLILETARHQANGGVAAGVCSPDEAEERVKAALAKGLLKVIAKMGISTITSYCGAQIFEAVGLAPALVDAHFTGTPSRIGGVDLDVVAMEALDRHARAWPQGERRLPVGGLYAWRRDGEHHMWNPTTVAHLQAAVRNGGGRQSFTTYSRAVDEDAARRATLRGLLRFRTEGHAVDLDDVEPAAEIVRRFATGAMSLGSISPEAHETLAVAMNRIGAKSNTGEGGEDPRRWAPDPNGDRRRSAIKQVASARFGVTVGYLVEADDLQIKISQGSKPGEGGQLPGHKVSEYIARLRHSTPGVELISPPPHHDIYSIEDLKQLIYDLRGVNPSARVSVKLASEVGVGTVAAGVAKAKADHVTISGHDGGTGASPWSSIKHAGTPWELGLAETQQTLVLNRLRSRIAVQVDGQLKTGRDVVVGAMLGADEFGFATAPLVASGCIMMRKCHLNTCPVGVATQDPELRKKFTGKPEHVVNFLFFVAEEARELMARLGIRRLDDLIGRTDLLDMKRGIEHWKACGLDFTRVFHRPEMPADVSRRRCEGQDHGLDKALDNRLIELAQAALEGRQAISIEMPIRNTNRTVGTMLSGEIARRFGHEGLPPERNIRVRFAGSAGQSFGAFLARGVTMELIGDTNDYCGKGLSGGKIVVQPSPKFRGEASQNIITGNVVLYGAICGEAYFRGVAGERFAVRNSGALAVVEGIGDHGCEYMTGGTVVVLGTTGRNFAAGMSGGVAYVFDPDGTFQSRCNTAMVALEPVLSQTEQEAKLPRHLWHLDATDETILRALVDKHARLTGSNRAGLMLENWAEARSQFIKVFPHEYRRALTEAADRNRKLAA
ncbi:MAG: glutamate synthase large subunit, partial [Burkholderiales bacterium]